MERTDEELVSAYLGGEEAAFSMLVERHLKTVYSFIAGFVGNAHEAEDITQETFLKAWRSISGYKKDSSKFKTWILHIARNSAIDFLRKRKHIPFSHFEDEDGQNVLVETIPDTNALPDEVFAKHESVEKMQAAIAALPPEAREVLLLHYTNGLTFQEIGLMLEQSPNTVKSRHHRALQSLRTLLRQ